MMADEKRLVDAIALISKARRMETTDNNGIPVDTFAVPVMAIEDAPTVDAVEVVRCRDCGNSEPCNPPRGRVWCRKLCRYMNEDGYCSEPERKANGMQG